MPDGRAQLFWPITKRHNAVSMPVLEVAILQVIPAQTLAFEQAFTKAQVIIAASPGYVSHELQRCLEKPNQYILLVRWQKLADHTDGFRQSAAYQEWKKLLHHFYSPFPVVEHYEAVVQ
ncbi:antibiotic biosynthesis monooxygenase [Hymenobacter sp. J193]|uniref:antibiotic biosynthesis monooxygenase family protein n=1 Tax=Hymenobacter sp. J193 TaxID=2898429 RepID=UPI002151F84B|nr:antibiotic biosynthesis monooxygenase [Hymenobacter sp. J193]MCR5887224.1 antibiotic biosynthesis monooxygenase [Hymenobacter sp. J193]